jgi:hypothetical protein
MADVVDFFLTQLNGLNNIYLMSMAETFGRLKQKCKECFSDAINSIFKNIFTWLIVLIGCICLFVLILIRQFLDHTFELSAGQILVCSTVFCIIVVLVNWAIYQFRPRRTVSDYCSDVIYDIVWEWDSFQYGKVGNIEPIPICPACSYHLHYQDHPLQQDFTLIECEDCHWWTDLKGDYDSIKLRVIKIVEFRIRSDDWMNAQTRLKTLKK